MHHIDYQYLRPEKAAALKKWYDQKLEIHTEPQIWQGCNATILPLRKDPEERAYFGLGGVVDESGQYVELSCIPNSVQYPYSYENAEYRDEKVVYCGYLINHWGHFLVDSITRLWYYTENDSSVDKYVFFIEDGSKREITGNYRKFFELLKIWDKLEIINKPVTYREVIVPELGIVKMTSYVPKLLQVFDTIAENVVPDPGWKTPSKIFFSRSQFAKGMQYEFGFDAIDNFFEKNGYQILYPEKVPLDEMIHYIRNADVVAALSGTLPHNILFAKQGQHLEVVERHVVSDDDQVSINQMREIQALNIDANIPIYPTDFAGPYILGYTPELKYFAENHGYQAPDANYLSKAHYRKCFINYMKVYKDLYNYRWFMGSWYHSWSAALYEGYLSSLSYFGDYLNRKAPFQWHHYFEFHYFKQFIKRLLKMQ